MDNALISPYQSAPSVLKLDAENRRNYKFHTIEDGRAILNEIRKRLPTCENDELPGIVSAWDKVVDRLRVIAGDPLPKAGSPRQLNMYQVAKPRRLVDLPVLDDPLDSKMDSSQTADSASPSATTKSDPMLHDSQSSSTPSTSEFPD